MGNQQPREYSKIGVFCYDCKYGGVAVYVVILKITHGVTLMDYTDR